MTERDVLSPRSPWLWYAVGGPPLIWGAQVAIGDLIFELGCGPAIRGQGFLLLSLKAWSVILTAACAGAAAVGFAVAMRALRVLRTIPPSSVRDRAYAFALSGVAIGIVFFILTSYSFLTPAFLPTCGGTP